MGLLRTELKLEFLLLVCRALFVIHLPASPHLLDRLTELSRPSIGFRETKICHPSHLRHWWSSSAVCI